jgi:hypothetical protein
MPPPSPFDHFPYQASLHPAQHLPVLIHHHLTHLSNVLPACRGDNDTTRLGKEAELRLAGRSFIGGSEVLYEDMLMEIPQGNANVSVGVAMWAFSTGVFHYYQTDVPCR